MLKTTKSKIALLIMLLAPLISLGGINPPKTQGLFELKPISKKQSSEKKYLYRNGGLDVHFSNDLITYVTKEKREASIVGNRIDLLHKNTSLEKTINSISNSKQTSKLTISLNGKFYQLISVDSILYNDIYSNIDLMYFLSSSGELTYHYFVNKGANISDIQVEYVGAENLSLTKHGDLSIKIGSSFITESHPKTFENISSVVNSNFSLNENTLEYNIQNFSPNHNYIIDPVISYTTYLGGSASDFGTDLVIDDSSNVYGVGTTFSPNFPVTTGTYDVKEDVVVFKMDSLGNLKWANYFGGNEQDEGKSIAINRSGEVFVTGFSKSFILPNIVATNPGDRSAFILKLANNGSVLQAKFLGGNGADEGNSIIAFGDSIIVTGVTSSANFPTAGLGATTSYQLGRDAFLTVMNNSLTNVYSGFFGGSSSDIGKSVTIDGNNNIIIGGETESTDLIPVTITTANQPIKGALDDAFIARFSINGVLNYASYYGGNGLDQLNGIATDNLNNIFIVGSTRSTDLAQPVTGVSFQNINKDREDVYVTKFNQAGVPQWGTYYGDTLLDQGNSIAVNNLGTVIITGLTESGDFPVDSNALQPTKSNLEADAFIVQFDNNGNRQYSSFLGGSNRDEGNAVVYDPNQSSYVLFGNTRSVDFPTGPNAYQTANAGDNDIFIYTSCSLIPNNKITAAGLDTLRYCSNDPNVNIEGTTPLGGSGNYTFKFQISNDSTSGFVDITNSNVEDLPVSQINQIFGWNTIRRIVSDGFCRDTSNITVINYLSAPLLNFSFDTLCRGDSIQFTDLTILNGGIDSIRTWAWEFGDGQRSIIQNPKVVFDTTGPLRAGLTVTASNGCFDGNFTNFPITETPVANFSFTTQCKDKTVQFTNTSSRDIVERYFYNFGDGTTSINENPIKTFPVFGKYFVTLAIGSEKGCRDTTILQVGTDSVIVADFITSDNACKDSSVTFIDKSQANTNIIAWNWDFGNGTTSTLESPTTNYSTSGTFSVKLIVRSASGCVDSTLKNVVIGSTPIADFTFVRNCTDNPTQFTDASTSSNGTIDRWFWNFGDGNTDSIQNPTNIFNSATPFVVTLTAITKEGCSNLISKSVLINQSPVVNAGPDVTIIKGQSVLLNATTSTANATYSWFPITGINPPNVANPAASPAVTTNYVVIVTDAMGCQGEDAVKITVNEGFFIPTLFTPNGDGDNDRFEIIGLEKFPNHNMTIFNRWGSEIYSSNGSYVLNPWDGTYSDEESPIGAYYYVLDLGEGSKLIKGTITILK